MLRRISVIALVALCSPLAALAETAGGEAPPASVAALPAITVSTVSREMVRDRVLASGLIGAVERVSVQPRIEGQAIEEVLVEIGDHVDAGQLMVRLSEAAMMLRKTQLQAQLAQAEASIAQAGAQLVEAEAASAEAERVRARTETLRAQGTASQAAADQAGAGAEAAVARVTVAQQGLKAAQAMVAAANAQIADVDLQLLRTKVVAPVTGDVVERTANVGAIASAAGQPLFVIVRDGLLELRADVAEQDILRLADGQSATLSLVGFKDKLSGVVRLVEPTVDVVTRLGRVRISVAETGRVRSGMFAEAEILVAEREALVVPVTAVSRNASGEQVLRVVDGRVSRVEVTTGIRDGGLVEILSGLGEGDQIVTRAGAFVRDGDRINPVTADASASN